MRVGRRTMTSRDFCYWLQDIFEVANPRELGPEAPEKIKAHLALVFIHEIDPSMGGPSGGGSGPGGTVYRC